MPTMSEAEEARCFTPIAKANGETLKLAMQELFLTGRILPVGAHLLVSHRFRSAEPKMLEVVYSFILPRDAALRRFEAKGKGFAVHSEREAVAAARVVDAVKGRKAIQGDWLSLAKAVASGKGKALEEAWTTVEGLGPYPRIEAARD